MPLPDAQPRRCAIYTRKSVEGPTDHQFSSLEAQRAICSSYIASQQPKGWAEVAKHYDDSGQSGGTLSRPALQELLADIECGMIDVVVMLLAGDVCNGPKADIKLRQTSLRPAVPRDASLDPIAPVNVALVDVTL
jgi:hypothetical protein